MVSFIAVAALLVFAAMPAIAREIARRKIRNDVRIDVAPGASADEGGQAESIEGALADPPPALRAAGGAASGPPPRR